MKKQLLGTICGLMVTAGAFAQSNEIVLSTDVLKFGGEAATQQVKINKGKGFVLFSYSDWMTCKTNKDGSLSISVKPYNHFYPRKASVILTSKKTNYSKVLTVVQTDGKNRPERIERVKGGQLLYLTDMDLSKSVPFYVKEVKKNKSVDNHELKLKGSRYADGVGTHAPTAMYFKLNGAKRFIAEMGIDDEIYDQDSDPTTWGDVSYEALVDGKVVKSGRFRMSDGEVTPLNLDVTGGKFLTLRFLSGASTFGDHVDLCNARFEYGGEKPVMVTEAEMKQPEVKKPAPEAPTKQEVASQAKQKAKAKVSKQRRRARK